MPVIIRELVIRANVAEPAANNEASSSEASNANRETIVKECVEQVLEIIEKKGER